MKKLYNLCILVILATLASCQKDPASGIKSHERAIEAVTLSGTGVIQVGPAVVDRTNSTVTIRVLQQAGVSYSSVVPTITTSYKSTISPASGQTVNFASSNNKTTYTVTAETGETRTWSVILQPFTEDILGTYKITDFTVYGGTGPQYGGGAVFDLNSKGKWPANGPSAEYDNTLTFTYTGVTSTGNTQGTMVNNAGADGQYANYIFSNNPVTDVNSNYRVLPKGNGTWMHDYTANTITFTFADGTVKTCTYAGPGTVSLGNNLTKTITDNAFVFTLTGADDYNDIYSDYDKIVKRPYTLWVDVTKQ